MKLAFMGTPSFAVPTLQALLEHPGHRVDLVVTQPDRPRCRSTNPACCPVKEVARERGIPVMQPERIRDAREVFAVLEQKKFDAVIVVAYGQLIPADMLKLARYGFINVHASLLPLYRGAAPINRAIIDGQAATGISIMQLDEGMDTGPVFVSAKSPIAITDTAASLSAKLAELGAGTLLKALEMIEGGLSPQVQDHARATYAAPLQKSEGLIDWNRDVRQVHDHIRGMQPWPGAFTFMEGKLLKIMQATRIEIESSQETGMLIKESKKVMISCKGGYIIPETVQLEGRKAIDATAFANGLRSGYIKLEQGEVL